MAKQSTTDPFQSLGRFSEPALHILISLADGPKHGYAMIDEVFAPGMSAMAAPVLRRHEAIGVISIAGPRTRLSVARMQELAPALLAAAAELGPISNASSLFGRPPLGKG